MTQLSATALTIAVLSLAVLMFFAVFTPDVAIKPEETELVVGACTLTVVAVRWLLRRWGRHRVSA